LHDELETCSVERGICP